MPGSANPQAGNNKKVSVETVSGHRDTGGLIAAAMRFTHTWGERSEVNDYLRSSTSAPSASTPAPASFDAGNVISDGLFYNKDSMSESEIKAFIQDTGKDCKPGSGSTCLKDTKSSTQNLTTLRSGCKPIRMSGSQTPWTIVHKTAQACGLNPRVLLAMLQKEQSGLGTAQVSRDLGEGDGVRLPRRIGMRPCPR